MLVYYGHSRVQIDKLQALEELILDQGQEQDITQDLTLEQVPVVEVEQQVLELALVVDLPEADQLMIQEQDLELLAQELVVDRWVLAPVAELLMIQDQELQVADLPVLVPELGQAVVAELWIQVLVAELPMVLDQELVAAHLTEQELNLEELLVVLPAEAERQVQDLVVDPHTERDLELNQAELQVVAELQVRDPEQELDQVVEPAEVDLHMEQDQELNPVVLPAVAELQDLEQEQVPDLVAEPLEVELQAQDRTITADLEHNQVVELEPEVDQQDLAQIKLIKQSLKLVQVPPVQELEPAVADLAQELVDRVHQVAELQDLALEQILKC